MTYEAPPDNNHKVVRLHGTTESLPERWLLLPAVSASVNVPPARDGGVTGIMIRVVMNADW